MNRIFNLLLLAVSLSAFAQSNIEVAKSALK